MIVLKTLEQECVGKKHRTCFLEYLKNIFWNLNIGSCVLLKILILVW